MANQTATSEGDFDVASNSQEGIAPTGPRPVDLDSTSSVDQYATDGVRSEEYCDWIPNPQSAAGPHGASPTSGSKTAATFGYRPPGSEFDSGQESSFAASRNPEPTFSTKPLTPPAKPASPPKRPKGRLFIGVILFSLIATGFYTVWNSTLRYAAYGLVDGRVIKIAAPWGGIVQSLHVREGATVRQGELLVTLQNLELQQQLEEISDQLKIGQAEIEAEVARHHLRAEEKGDQNQKALAEYYELWGTLLEEQAELTSLETKLERLGSLKLHDVVSDEEWDSTRFAADGQQAKVEKLKTAVQQLRARAEPTAHKHHEVERELQPQLARLKYLQAKLPRLRAQIEQGKIRAPVDGRVVKRNIFAGEYANKATTVLEVLEEGSLEVVVYVSQRQASRLTTQKSIPISIEPNAGEVTCQVCRIGDRLEPAPEKLRRYYSSGETLVPVYLEPLADPADRIILRLGSEVRLPHTWNSSISPFGMFFPKQF